ncbi:MAG: hypothetical protein ACREQB_07255 [Candidatus Binataceae bacterium]
MQREKPQVVICTYRVKRGSEAAFRHLLRKHWSVLNRMNLVTKQPRLVLRGLGNHNRGDLIEVFAWRRDGFQRAHKSPEVLAIWEPMEKLCQARGGHPAMEFPHYETFTP